MGTTKNHEGMVGGDLGFQGVEQLTERAAAVCQAERERIALRNRPRIRALECEIASRGERERDLKDRLRLAAPPGDEASRRRKARFAWTITGVLAVAGYFFALLSFAPFRLGWMSYLYCLGIAIVALAAIDLFLKFWESRNIARAITLVAFVAAMTALSLLAVIRGQLLSEHVKAREPVVIIDDQNAVPQEQPTTFYERTLLLLVIFSALAAVAMELVAGFTLHEAQHLARGGEDREMLWTKLAEVQIQMTVRLEEFTMLENEPAAFEALFWRDFYHSLLTNTARKSLAKLVVVAVAALCLSIPRLAEAQDRLALVVAVDLTQSVAVAGSDGKTEFQKNLDAVARLLGTLPSGSQVTVIGITDRSFTQPSILLAGQIPDDPGYFGERLTTARRELVRAWRARSSKLVPQSRYTDVLGAFLVAGEILRNSPKASRKSLVLFSDMRHHTSDLDLESPAVIPEFARLQRKTANLVPDLRGVGVYVLGVDGAGKSVAYWKSLEMFWRGCCLQAGVRSFSYSVLRGALELCKDERLGPDC